MMSCPIMARSLAVELIPPATRGAPSLSTVILAGYVAPIGFHINSSIRSAYLEPEAFSINQPSKSVFGDT